MEKNTILAVLLSVIVITAGMVITQTINKRYVPPFDPQDTSEQDNTKTETVPLSQTAAASAKTISPEEETSSGALERQNYPARTIVEETDTYRITFNTVGAVAADIVLLKQQDKNKPISMVLDRGSGVGTFNLAFGGPEVPYITDVFSHERQTDGEEIIHIFKRDYMRNNQIFTLSKTYKIIPNEYVIELTIGLETPDGKAVPLLDGNEPAYTLTYGPQIGPDFTKIDGRYEIRDNVTWGPNSKRGKYQRVVHRDKSNIVQINNIVDWAGVVGKYFAIIVTPNSGSSGATITWDTRPSDGLEEPSRLQISRPPRRAGSIYDVYRFFIGPLDRKTLSRYDKAADNAFGISNMGLQNVPRTSALLGWLQTILRVLLEFFYGMIPNYGVAIILLTIVVKAALYPITHKTYESTSKMQAIQPKVKELQARYKGEPQKMNAKLAELYKAEGVNPMGGCLPMLLQLPIFIALYGLLNRYFPLRGAAFIPGWITDLSAPEYIWREFSQPINLLIINIPAIRILPVLYLAGQLLMTKVTQQGTTGGQAGSQQKMLTLGMPIIFFFILYNMPSGLLLYWTMMNLITIGQQLITNQIKKSKAAGGAA